MSSGQLQLLRCVAAVRGIPGQLRVGSGSPLQICTGTLGTFTHHPGVLQRTCSQQPLWWIQWVPCVHTAAVCWGQFLDSPGILQAGVPGGGTGRAVTPRAQLGVLVCAVCQAQGCFCMHRNCQVCLGWAKTAIWEQDPLRISTVCMAHRCGYPCPSKPWG